jgi:hypothetical protein
MFYEIYCVNDFMILMDEDGNSYECRDLVSYREAKRLIREWASQYRPIAIAASDAKAEAYFRFRHRAQASQSAT